MLEHQFFFFFLAGPFPSAVASETPVTREPGFPTKISIKH